MDKLKSFSLFLFLGLMTAVVFEEIPRITRQIIGQLDSHIWQWPLGVLFWYILIFTIFYFVFIDKPAKYSVIFGVILGFIAEIFIFKTVTLVLLPLMLLMIPITYGWIFYVPQKVFRLIKFGEKFRLINVLIIVGLNILTVIILLLLPRA